MLAFLHEMYSLFYVFFPLVLLYYIFGKCLSKLDDYNSTKDFLHNTQGRLRDLHIETSQGGHMERAQRQDWGRAETLERQAQPRVGSHPEDTVTVEDGVAALMRHPREV